MPRPLIALGVAAIVAVLLVSCASEPTPQPPSAPTPRASVGPSGNGVLRIGTAFPATDSSIGPAQVAGVEVAVREINEAGGVLGVPVQVFHRASGENGSDQLTASFTNLQGMSIDVFIGPTASGAADSVLVAATDAHIPIVVPSRDATGDGYLFYLPVPAVGAQSIGLPAEPDDAFAARLRMSDPGVTDLRYALEAYDAVIIAALAAILAGDDGGASIAANIASVMADGIACTSFGQCLDVLETEPDIAYGASIAQP